jgi:alpha-1,3-rhamnosyl/mannosyltransferase
MTLIFSVEPVRFPLTGIGRYAYELALRLQQSTEITDRFGLPVLEAMSSGVPVVCSNSSSLPEVAGEAALVCDAKDTETLTQLIRRGLEDEMWRANAVEQGLVHAARFSWERCAMQTLEVYQKVIKGQ